MRRRRWLLLPLALLPAASLAAPGCRAPTQVTLKLRTDIPCSALRGAEIRVGTPSDAEAREPVTETTTCEADGTIGTLVVVPSGAADADVEIVVVAGREVDPATSCKAPSYQPPNADDLHGCVVARRRLHFIPHEPLTLPIDLRNKCVGVPCAPGSTCVDGACFDATISNPSACAGGAACDESTLTTPAPRPDAGAGGAGGSTSTGSGGAGGTTTTGGGGAGGTTSTGSGGAGGTTGGGGSGGGTATIVGLDAPSCIGAAPCAGGRSCCESRLVEGGTFEMGRSTNGGADAYAAGAAGELPAHTVTVSSFYLDTFEVTVERFKKFSEQAWAVPLGAGAHPKIPGSGFPKVAGASGWYPDAGSYMSNAPASCAATGIHVDIDPSWKNLASPMNCVNYFEAFAFCAWDGGRLPTEAEWELAAAGGGGAAGERLYPWGPALPAAGSLAFDTAEVVTPPGSHPTDVGRWGQLDLGGSLAEWVFDAYHDGWYGTPEAAACKDCVNFIDWDDGGSPPGKNVLDIAARPHAVYRGGSGLSTDSGDLRATRRRGHDTFNVVRQPFVGFRCARDLK